MKIVSLILAVCLLLAISITASAERVFFMGDIPEDSVGIWSVPSIHYSCPVYTAHTWREWQPIVDAEQSMLMNMYMNCYAISDHHGSIGLDGESKWLVEDIRLLSTAYLITPTETRKYECYMTAVAVPESWGYLVNGRAIQPTSSLDILVRCCVGSDSTRNYIAMFRYVKTLGQ